MLSHHPRRRIWIAVRVLAVVLSIILVAWGVTAYRLIGHPHLDRPTAADAVVVLGPPEDQDVVAFGQSLIAQGLARYLLVSIAPRQRGQVGRMCRDQTADPTGTSLTCFVPDPTTTRGEARTVSRLVTRNHWHRVIVVTPVYHIERARMVFQRCPHETLEFVAPPDQASTTKWVFESLYQTGAFLKAAAETGC